MDRVRYVIAVALLVSLPGGITYWFWVHPFIAFWRRVGLTLTLVVNLGWLVVLASAVFHWRASFLRYQFGTNPLLLAIGLPLVVLSVILRRYVARQLTTSTLVGFPEIAPDRFEQRLLTEGIYARIRHPRYVVVFLTVLGFALIANYLATYILTALLTAALLCVVLLEEKELRQRFGSEYQAYARRVPRFLPKVSWKARS